MLLYFNSKLSHQYNTLANSRRKTEDPEQKNREVREEVTALKAGMATLTTLMESLVAAYNQPPLAQPQQIMITSEALTVPVSATPVTVVRNRMPQGYLWGMLENFMPYGYNQDAQFSPHSQAAATSSPPLVNALPFINDEVYHLAPPPSESMGFYDRLDDFQDQFNKM